MSAIIFSMVSKAYGKGRKKIAALSELSLTIAKGEVFGFLGPNGAGKSTTIKLLLNLLRPDQGTMRLRGLTVGREEFRPHIGYLPEFPCFYDHLSAWETLQLCGGLSGLNRDELRRLIPTMLARVELEECLHQRVGGFSKGMKQRLGMAVALLHDPEILIFDEPMSGLDPLGRHRVKELMGELKAQGKTIFFSSHILSDIEELCDRIGIISHGRLLYCGGLTEFTQGEKLEGRFVDLVTRHGHARA